MSVIEGKFPREKGGDGDGPHLAGKAVCLHCGHEWAAVAPIGTTELMECPKCRLFKGIYKYGCVRKELPHWECDCGNQFFAVTEHGYYCPLCGEWAKGF